MNASAHRLSPSWLSCLVSQWPCSSLSMEGSLSTVESRNLPFQVTIQMLISSKGSSQSPLGNILFPDIWHILDLLSCQVTIAVREEALAFLLPEHILKTCPFGVCLGNIFLCIVVKRPLKKKFVLTCSFREVKVLMAGTTRQQGEGTGARTESWELTS